MKVNYLTFDEYIINEFFKRVHARMVDDCWKTFIEGEPVSNFDGINKIIKPFEI
jgi:hypothetical protein